MVVVCGGEPGGGAYETNENFTLTEKTKSTPPKHWRSVPFQCFFWAWTPFFWMFGGHLKLFSLLVCLLWHCRYIWGGGSFIESQVPKLRWNQGSAEQPGSCEGGTSRTAATKARPVNGYCSICIRFPAGRRAEIRAESENTWQGSAGSQDHHAHCRERGKKAMGTCERNRIE